MRGHLLVDVPMVSAAISLYPSYGLMPVAWLGAASLLIHSWAVINPRSSLYLPVYWRLPADCPSLALTFDDGPNPESTPHILDLLASHGQRATFFVIGEHVRRHPHLVARMVAEGHAVGLHSDSHSRLVNCWPPHLVRRDLARCGQAISDACGIPAPRLYRPVVGLKNPVIGFVAGRLDLVAVTWSCRALDTTTRDTEAVVKRLLHGLAPRSILVMHDGYEPGRPHDRTGSVAVIRRLLTELATRGLTSVPILVHGRRIAAGAAAPAVPSPPASSAAR